MRLASGYPWKTNIANIKLVHDADVKLLYPFTIFARGMINGECDIAEMHERTVLQAALDEMAAQSGLPITMRMVAAPRDEGRYGGPRHAILLDGYGVGGKRDTMLVRSVTTGTTRDSLIAMIRNDEEFSRQLRRHRDFGPIPLEAPQKLTMDAPSARRLAETGRGSLIAQAIADGRPGDAGDAGVAFRVSGRSMLGTFELAPGVIWKGDRLDVQMTTMSDVVCAALAGRSIRDVVSHPAVGIDDLVRRVEQRKSKTANTLVVHATTRMVALDDIDALAA